jgi:hypothetical protein
MPADDDEMDPEELDELDEDGAEEIEDEPDAEELDDEEEVGAFGLEDEDEDTEAVDTEEDEEEDEDADETPSTRTKRRTGDEEEDEDDELLSPDDVEADLDRILKDRLVTSDEDDEDEDEDEPDERGETGDRLQPKRADEQLCPNCFLLVRANAPGCPVGDDDCPIFG